VLELPPPGDHERRSLGDDVLVPAFGPRMVCTRCGIIGADARPNWREHRARDVKKTRFQVLLQFAEL
jgi:hypothetical protein